MFGLGWSELMVVGIVALIVVGPKDLPGLFRTVGQYTGKAKAMAREFSSAMNAAADQAGVGEIQKTLNAAVNPKKFGVDKIREASGLTAAKSGPATAALSEERQAAKEKISAATAKAATDRKAREAAAAEGAATEAAKPVAKKPAAKKPAAKKPAAKAAPATKPTAKEPAAKPAAKKPAAKKPAAKKPAAKKPAAPKGDA
ncbi:MAG: Sec-independent protein translocase protein TatB [Octadecabacter sp.]